MTTTSNQAWSWEPPTGWLPEVVARWGDPRISPPPGGALGGIRWAWVWFPPPSALNHYCHFDVSGDLITFMAGSHAANRSASITLPRDEVTDDVVRTVQKLAWGDQTVPPEQERSVAPPESLRDRVAHAIRRAYRDDRSRESEGDREEWWYAAADAVAPFFARSVTDKDP